MLIEYVLVFVLAILAGAWSTAAGIYMELDPVGVFVAATAGSLTFATIVLFGAGPWRDRMMDRYFPDADARVAASPLGGVRERWGIPGLALASVAFGPALTLTAALVFGVDRRRFFPWYAAVTVVGFAVSTAFWVAVAP